MTAVQRSNQLKLTAWGYELWRRRSTGWLTGGRWSLASELEALRCWSGAGPGQYWLDLGCSTALYARTLASQGARVTAVDLSTAMLAAAARRCRDLSGIDFLCADIEGTGLQRFLAGQGADGIAMGATLNECHQPELALSRAAAALRPGGKLFLMYLKPAGGAGGWLAQLPFRAAGVRFCAPAAVGTQLARCGLTRLQQRSERNWTLELYRKQERSVANPKMST